MAERELIQVERDEQINGLVRRLKQSGARQVTFVVPEAAAVLRNPVNLRLLRFYAEQEEKRLRLVTSDAVVQRLADEAGIDWAPPEKGEAPRAAAVGTGQSPASGPGPFRPRAAHLLVLPALLLLIGVWQLLAGPAVTVTVRPVVQERAAQVTLQGRVGGRGGAGEVPLTLLQQPVTGSGSVAATGRQRLGISPARGSVTFLNQAQQAVKVPAGTLVATAAGTAFRVAEAVEVPGVKAEYFMKIAVGIRAGQAEARVEAVTPGSEGNVAAGRVVKLKSALPGRLQVTNPEPLRGGEDRTVAVVTAADVGRAEREASAAVARQAREALEAQLPQGLQLIPASVRLSPPAVTTKEQVGDEAAGVTATATVTAFALAYRPETVKRTAAEAWRRTVPPGMMVVQGSLSPGAPEFGRVEPQLAEFLVRVTGLVAPELEAAAVRQAARGKTPAAAEAAVKALPGVDQVTLEGARRRLPSWSGRLRVKILAPATGAL